MIKKLQKKFILITILSLFAALAIIVATVNILNVRSTEASLDSASQMILDNGGTLNKHMPAPGKNAFKAAEDRERKHRNSAEMPFAVRFFSVTYDDYTGEHSLNLEHIVSVTGDTAYEYADAMIAQNKSVGWYKNYRYRYVETPNGYILVAVEATAEQYAISSVMKITSIVALIALVIISLIVIPLSGRAVKPLIIADEKQKRFITEAGHELKTPLTVISANAEMLRMENNPEWCEGIIAQSETMRTLLDKMIRLSRLDEGNAQLQHERFDFGDAVYDAAMIYQSVAKSKELDLQVNVQEGMSFLGDEESVRQVTSILVDNAVKYCDASGSIQVSAYADKGLAREKLIVQVTNTFADSQSLEVDKIFDRFYRADKAHSADNSFGLGLPIAKSIVEHHQGTIKAEATADGRVVFTAAFC